MAFISRKRIALGPAFFFQVSDNVLFSNSTGFFPKEPDSFFDSSVMMSNPAVPHPVFFATMKLIKPLMHCFIGFAKQRY